MGIQFTRNYRFDCEFVLKYTFLLDHFFVFLTVFFFAKFLKTVHTVRQIHFKMDLQFHFKSLARLSSRIKNCTPLLLRTKT